MKLILDLSAQEIQSLYDLIVAGAKSPGTSGDAIIPAANLMLKIRAAAKVAQEMSEAPRKTNGHAEGAALQ